MPTQDDNIYAYALQKNPALKTKDKAQVIAYAKSKLGEGKPRAEFTQAQMENVQEPVQEPYLDVISKGLMQEPLPSGQSLGRKVVHGLYQELPPTLGAIAGTPAGPAGIMAGAAAGRALQKGAGALARASTGMEPAKENPVQVLGDVMLTGATQGIGAKATTAGIGGLKAGAQGSRELAVNEVNALLKPKTVNYVYGKNPGKAVIDEGIVGKTFEEIHGQLENKLEEVGKLYDPLISKYSKKRINVDNFTAPLDMAMAKARRNPRTNKALLTRLENAKRDLRMELDDLMTGEALPGAGSFKNMSPKQALELKRAIGEITKFTENQQEDTIVNAALKHAYRIVDNKLDAAVPGIAALNTRWANLLGATVAARNKALLGMNKRQWVTPMAEVVGGAGIGALAGKPLTGAAIGAGGALVHKLAQSPKFVVGASRAMQNKVAPAFDAAARGLESAAGTQLPQSAMRRGLESDPLGLFND